MEKEKIVVVVCVIYFAAMILIGIIAARRNKATSDYLVAGRRLNVTMTAITLAAVQIGVGIVLSSATNGYDLGVWPGMYYAFGCGGGLIIAGLVTTKKLREQEGYVPLDYFAQRYGESKAIRLWAWISNVPSLLGIFIAQLLASGGILAGLVCAVIFGTLVFHLGSSGMVVSIAMNLGMDAFTSFLLLNIFGKRGSFMDPRLISLPVIKLPLLSKIPYLGEIFGAHNLVVYFTLLSIMGAWIAMYKTPFGLRLRSVGINEKAAQTTGTNVLRYKWYSVLITGFFVGIAGAILPLGGTSIFTENMSAGRGFLAVAAIMIAKGNPVMAADRKSVV